MDYIKTVCFNCGNEEAETFLVEQITCQDCNSIIEITYNRCEKCTTVWKAVGDEILSAMNMDEFTCPAGLPADYILDNVDLGDIPVIEHAIESDSMEDQIHKCVRCNEPAYEIDDGLYQCSNTECGFQWEVVKCG